MKKQRDFIFDNEPNHHIKRRAEILSKHPEIRNLYGAYPPSAIYIILIVTIQLIFAYFLRNQAWWIVALVAYAVGACE